MRADSGFRDDENIVPHGTNASVAAAVSGCSVRVHSLSMQVARGTSIADVGVICVKLLRSKDLMSLTYQFCIGDAYLFTLPYSKARKELECIVERDMGKSYMERLRHFGSIAKRWPADRRSGKLPWQYYKDHKPGEPGQPDILIVKKRIRLTPVSVEVVDGVEVEVFAGRGEQEYEVVRTVKP